MWPNIAGGHHSVSGYSVWLPGSSATRYRESVRPKISAIRDRRFFSGIGTTFAAVPDLIAMFRRRSSVGMNPRMAAIMGIFQILWVYYGLLIQSRPVIAWKCDCSLDQFF
jgi:hypothetical protein